MIAPVFVVIAGLASLTAAQSVVGLGNQTIVPESVDINTRNGWCGQQKNTCSELCPGKLWDVNECSTTNLTASCVCADGSKPNLAEYKDTLLFQICQAYIGQCVENNATEPDLQAICRNTNTCGSLDPADVVFSTTLKTTSMKSTSTSAVGTATNPPAGTTSSTSTATNSPSAGMIIEPSANSMMGIFVLVAAMGLAGVGLVL